MCDTYKRILGELEDNGVDLVAVNAAVEVAGMDNAKLISEYATKIVMKQLDEKFLLMIASILRTIGRDQVTLQADVVRELNEQIKAKNYEVQEIPDGDTFTFRLKRIANNPIADDAWLQEMVKQFGLE